MNKQYPHYIIGVARRLRKESTSAESELRNKLRNRKLEKLKFIRQHPIGRYVADFYCHEHKTIIELEGKIHNKADQRQYDEVRFLDLSAQGYKILRIKNEEVLNNIELVLTMIVEFVKKNPHP